MEVKFADTFLPSLKRLIAHERWYWKVFYAIRYDIPRFIEHVWQYSRDLWHIRPWDANGSLRLMRTNLSILAKYLENYGNEVAESRNKKISKIHRAIEILNYHINDEFIELAETQLNKKVVTKFNVIPIEGDDDHVQLKFTDTEEEEENNSEIFELSRALEKDTWKELFEILHGQNIDDFKSSDDENSYNHWFDGSGMKGWWN